MSAKTSQNSAKVSNLLFGRENYALIYMVYIIVKRLQDKKASIMYVVRELARCWTICGAVEGIKVIN